MTLPEVLPVTKLTFRPTVITNTTHIRDRCCLLSCTTLFSLISSQKSKWIRCVIRNLFHFLHGSTRITNSFSSRIPTSNLMSLFNPSSNRVHIAASIETHSRAYLLNCTNTLSYSTTDLRPCFSSRNTFLFLSKYLWLMYFFLNYVRKNSQLNRSSGNVVHHWYA